MMYTNTIQIERGQNCWIAHYCSGPLRDDMLAVLSTDKVPTPYTLDAPRATVVSAIRDLNPDATVC